MHAAKFVENAATGKVAVQVGWLDRFAANEVEDYMTTLDMVTQIVIPSTKSLGLADSSTEKEEGRSEGSKCLDPQLWSGTEARARQSGGGSCQNAANRAHPGVHPIPTLLNLFLSFLRSITTYFKSIKIDQNIESH